MWLLVMVSKVIVEVKRSQSGDHNAGVAACALLANIYIDLSARCVCTLFIEAATAQLWTCWLFSDSKLFNSGTKFTTCTRAGDGTRKLSSLTLCFPKYQVKSISYFDFKLTKHNYSIFVLLYIFWLHHHPCQLFILHARRVKVEIHPKKL